MRIFVIGAGQVGSTIVEALHDEHELTVFDVDGGRLGAISYRFDVTAVQASGASRRALRDAAVEQADLLIACTSRDETNVIAAMLARGLSPNTKTIVRTTNVEYLEVWRERQLDVDFMVSPELETAHAVSRIIGVPAARQTDVFADGQVQIVEFEVEDGSGGPNVIGPALREAYIPPDSKVASIIRGGEMIVPRGDQAIQRGDRIIVIGSPEAAREWSKILAPQEQRVRSVVVFGGGRTGSTIADMLLGQGIDVRVIESDRERAVELAERLPKARCYHATGLDPEFLERERIGRAQAAIFAMRDDAKNHYAATLAKLHGVEFTIAIVHDAVSVEVFERAGIDVAVNPRMLAAEEMVRFAHDPRTRQVTMLEGDRYEILDVTVRPDSTLLGTPFRELPMTGALIGAIVRDGRAIFPHGDDALRPNDRVIVFTESSRAATVEKTL